MSNHLHEIASCYDNIATDYIRENEDRDVIARQRIQFINDVSGTRILDAGCGPGWDAQWFAEQGYETVGVDISERFLSYARAESRRPAFLKTDMRQLGLQADTFDGVWACASLLHLTYTDAKRVLSEFHRVLRDDGVIWVSVKRGTGQRIGDQFDGDHRRFILYERDELETLFLDQGFRIDTFTENDWIEVLARRN